MGKMKELYAEIIQNEIDEEQYLLDVLRRREEEYPSPEQYYGDRYQDMLDEYDKRNSKDEEE